MISHLLTKPEVAKLLRCSVRQINYLVKRDGLPVIHIGIRARYPRGEVEKWLWNREAYKPPQV